LVGLNADEYETALRILRECTPQEEPSSQTNGTTVAGGAAKNSKEKPTGLWSPTELQLLVKAVNLYPPGSQQRWKVSI
jgi:hypothetical protein